ncbi:MAG TPA: hypothetical protein PKL59_23140, partial [Nitrospira sp.]|nr:hypothetical protein [Nitrospira sp.]
SETDATVTLAGHPLALARQWTAGAGEGAATGAGQGKLGDFGNWTLPLLATRLTSDQPATLDNGSLAPWTDGARVWISLPADLADAQAGTLHLAFTLTTPSERLASEPGAPQIWHPVFANAQGWTLQAHGRSEADSPDRLQSTDRPDSLIRLGERLYDQVTGLPWQPAAYTLIAPASASPAGTRYSLDGQGRIQAIRFADGQAWRVSDAGIAAVGSNAGERIDLQRDSAGRIARITLPEASAANSDGRTAIAYRYDSEGRLILVRRLGETGLGTPIAYDPAGQPLGGDAPLTAHLGAIVHWSQSAGANAWSGTLTTGQAATLAFAVRESEIASTVHVPGGQGAVLLALESQLPEDAHL